jgi:hypothetical protein
MNTHFNHQLGQMAHAEYSNYQATSWNVNFKRSLKFFSTMTAIGLVAGIFFYIS